MTGFWTRLLELAREDFRLRVMAALFVTLWLLCGWFVSGRTLARTAAGRGGLAQSETRIGAAVRWICALMCACMLLLACLAMQPVVTEPAWRHWAAPALLLAAAALFGYLALRERPFPKLLARRDKR